MGWNLPDDWGSYYHNCGRCGSRYHASEGGCGCADDMVECGAGCGNGPFEDGLIDPNDPQTVELDDGYYCESCAEDFEDCAA